MEVFGLKENESIVVEEDGWGERRCQTLCMMDGLVRKRGGGRGGLQKKNDPDCCCDAVGGNAGQKNMWGPPNQKSIYSTTLVRLSKHRY